MSCSLAAWQQPPRAARCSIQRVGPVLPPTRVANWRLLWQTGAPASQLPFVGVLFTSSTTLAAAQQGTLLTAPHRATCSTSSIHPQRAATPAHSQKMGDSSGHRPWQGATAALHSAHPHQDNHVPPGMTATHQQGSHTPALQVLPTGCAEWPALCLLVAAQLNSHAALAAACLHCVCITPQAASGCTLPAHSTTLCPCFSDHCSGEHKVLAYPCQQRHLAAHPSTGHWCQG